MKEDYLWDQTGADPEIEELERALKAFRYESSAPPALPVASKPGPAKPARRRFDFRLAFALAPVAAGVLVLLGVLVGLSRRDSAPPSEVAVKAPAQTTPERVPKPEVVDPPVQTAPETGRSVREAQTEPQKIRRPSSKAARFVKTVARRPDIKEIKNESLALSKDEQYAYDQLMLALSITSEKLRIVKDKIDGAGAPEARRAEER